MPRLTKKLIESSQITGKDHIIFDDELPGFGLRLLPSGRKVFIIQYRIGRRARRLTIGPYPIFTADAARTEATKVLAAIRSGKTFRLMMPGRPAISLSKGDLNNLMSSAFIRHSTSEYHFLSSDARRK